MASDRDVVLVVARGLAWWVWRIANVSKGGGGAGVVGIVDKAVDDLVGVVDAGDASARLAGLRDALTGYRRDFITGAGEGLRARDVGGVVDAWRDVVAKLEGLRERLLDEVDAPDVDRVLVDRSQPIQVMTDDLVWHGHQVTCPTRGCAGAGPWTLDAWCSHDDVRDATLTCSGGHSGWHPLITPETVTRLYQWTCTDQKSDPAEVVPMWLHLRIERPRRYGVPDLEWLAWPATGDGYWERHWPGLLATQVGLGRRGVVVAR